MEKENGNIVEVAQPSCSRPIHVQRLERALDLTELLNTQSHSNENSDEDTILISSDSDNDSDSNNEDWQGVIHFLNIENVDEDREWLLKLLDEESDNEDEEDIPSQINSALKARQLQLSLANRKQSLNSYAYYTTGLLSVHDKYPESKKLAVKPLKRKAKETDRNEYFIPHEIDETVEGSGPEYNAEPCTDVQNADEDSTVNSDAGTYNSSSHNASLYNSPKKKTRKFRDEESKKKWEEMMTIKRRKVFANMVKKEIGKQQRSKCNRHKEVLLQCKRVALQCQKVVRHKALHSARVVKEQQWRMKRLARENLAYWKRSKRVDREIRRKLEKEAEEQRKMDFELIEAKRQQRKLNFLITQTELYAHFMSKKLGKASPEEQLRILSQLDEEKNPRLMSIDDYDSEAMKAKAKKNAEEAFNSERQRTKNFDVEANASIDDKKIDSMDGEHPQPSIFRGNLKGYQLRGMNWLANLYDQGISGILADEMGLGKTVQSIAFLCHIAERYSVWGPFLIISPASTLHNWQQEIAKFVPDFKVVPYWGNPNERKILRQFWDQKDMHTKEASFHIVITSYQIVITDIKYFNRIKWQYMILDEAQAIKSTNSMRWKTLLGFSCRNRLLLSGTPIQNSMAELWALLHFIMPTLFDSHEEFNEWFSKDIESHAENKTGIDEKHLSRLHMILKPFMLRRIKKDVENELSDKIEIMVYCPLTTRQKLLYMALKQKIRIEDLLHYTVGGSDSHTVDKNFTSNLMNLVMQFRKVCNHPELFERRDAKSPLYIVPRVYQIPYLIYSFNAEEEKHAIIQKRFVFTPEYITHNIHEQETCFNFCLSLKLSPQELYSIFQGSFEQRWKNYYSTLVEDYHLYYRHYWNENINNKVSLRINPLFKMTPAFVEMGQNTKGLIFTWHNTRRHIIYTHTIHYYHSMPETVEHRKIRYKNLIQEDSEQIIDVVNDELVSRAATSSNTINKEYPYKERATQVFKCERTEMPSFLFCYLAKLETTSPILYCYSRKAAWDWKRHIDDFSYNSLNYYWSKATSQEMSSTGSKYFTITPKTALDSIRPINGWSNIVIPDKETLVTDSGKLSVLDRLLKRLKEEGHRVLIYSQMTKMIDLLEEYMWHRHHKYMRLDGSSKISERRDMVADFQARTDIFVFLLSTRAGGLGINLTAADTVIFYDSDWNPTVDQQAMDRAHRLGQTKQVTVYRLICKGSIEERILQRAREKSEIQKLVISGGNFKPDTLKPKEVVSLLLDDEEIEQKYRQRTEEKRQMESLREMERKRNHLMAFKAMQMFGPEAKRAKQQQQQQQEHSSHQGGNGSEEQWLTLDSAPNSPRSDNSPVPTVSDDLSDGSFLDIEGDSSINNKYTVYNLYGTTVKPRIPGRGTSKRGRPRGSRRVSALGRFNSSSSTLSLSSVPSVSGVGTPDSISARGSSPLALFDVPGPSQHSGTSSLQSSPGVENPTVRRGPGRPRLKPGGPPHTGTRGTYRPRKPAKPLPVPLPSDGGTISSSTTASSSYTSYLYEYTDQHSSDS